MTFLMFLNLWNLLTLFNRLIRTLGTTIVFCSCLLHFLFITWSCLYKIRKGSEGGKNK